MRMKNLLDSSVVNADVVVGAASLIADVSGLEENDAAEGGVVFTAVNVVLLVVGWWDIEVFCRLDRGKLASEATYSCRDALLMVVETFVLF